MKPEKFDNVFDLEIAVDMYFMDCDERKVPYTVEGMAYALDMDRRTLLRYETEETHAEFNSSVRRAKQRVAQNLIEKAVTDRLNPALIIFLLKNNFGYVDKTETEVNNKIDIQQITGMKITAE